MRLNYILSKLKVNKNLVIKRGYCNVKEFKDKKFSLFLNYLLYVLPKYIYTIIITENCNSLHIYLKNNKFISVLGEVFKKVNIFRFKTLSDICVVDYPSRINRFEIVYNFLNVDLSYNPRIFLHLFCSLNESINSLTNIFKSANWLERECWDMFGVFFFNHPDLRRILTDYGFDGFPMRKDFPLTGYIELRYDDEKMSISYDPVELAQEYRLFNFTSPWEKYK